MCAWNQVEKRLRQVERMQAMRSEVSEFLAGIHPALEAEDRSKSPGMRGTATESRVFSAQDRNQQLRTEKDHIAKHFQVSSSLQLG